MQQEAEKTVDIDTSGPGADIEIKEEQKEEQNVESTENSVESVDSSEKPVEQPAVQESEPKQETQETSEEKKEEAKQEQKKDLDDYSEGVKRRIGKLTRKLREAERQRDEATSYAQTVLADQEKLKSRLTKLDTGYVSEMENRIKSGMEAAVAKLAKAREDGDMKAEVIAQAEISKLGYEEARLSEMKNRSQVKKPQPVQQPTNQETQPTQSRDPRAEEWASKNTWFNKDLVMTEGARVIHRILTEEEGYDPVGNPEEYYAEIDRRIALEFPHKFGNTTVNETISKPTQVVASATRSPKTGRKIQRLTPSEVAIAKKLGVPLDEYAKSKRKITKEV
jgi:hypothetical protein|tara:strand:+ start:90 stop:1097 length:1008 start_codon:yes stop_codon:yes gene_type:complete